MKAMNSRTIIAVTAVVAFLGLLLLVGKLTVAGKNPPCPRCGKLGETRVSAERLTIYYCPSCQKAYTGPGRTDFSWGEAIHEMVDSYVNPPMGSQ